MERTIYVPILALKPGARLAQAVRRSDGLVLLAEGTAITTEQVRQLIQRGIDGVNVLQDETRDVAQIELEMEAATDRVTYLFRGKSNPSRDALAEAIADYRRQAAS